MTATHCFGTEAWEALFRASSTVAQELTAGKAWSELTNAGYGGALRPDQGRSTQRRIPAHRALTPALEAARPGGVTLVGMAPGPARRYLPDVEAGSTGAGLTRIITPGRRRCPWRGVNRHG